MTHAELRNITFMQSMNANVGILTLSNLFKCFSEKWGVMAMLSKKEGPKALSFRLKKASLELHENFLVHHVQP